MTMALRWKGGLIHSFKTANASLITCLVKKIFKVNPSLRWSISTSVFITQHFDLVKDFSTGFYTSIKSDPDFARNYKFEIGCCLLFDKSFLAIEFVTFARVNVLVI